MIKAIETRWKGYRFRSRLEARWAVFFDTLGLRWEYEPEGFDLGSAGWYLPDFRLLDVARRPYVEVKPADYEPSSRDMDKWFQFVAGTNCVLLVATGAPDLEPLRALVPYGSEDGPVLQWDHLCLSKFADDESWPGGRGPRPRSILADRACVTLASQRRYLGVAIDAARSARFEHGESPHG